ncbi:PAS domain S-box protein [Candidatus Daviesbacteria bacterium]|nr:PAS domain S-box protein [Candidatus Daviesbacteria bacterium]
MSLRVKIALIALTPILIPLLAVFFQTGILFTLITGLVSAVAVILIVFRLLSPLNALIKGTDTITSGNLNFRVDIRSHDELEKIGESFNSLAEHLKQSVEKSEQDKDIISAERNKLSAVISSVIDGIIAVDLTKNVVLANKTAQYLTGYSEGEMQGKPIDHLVRLFKDQEEVPVKTYCQIDFEIATPSAKIFESLTMVGKDARKVKVILTTSPISSGVQTNLGCILILHDLTHESELEQMKLDFVSMASHELKTPLTNIIGYLSVFMDENRQTLRSDQSELLDRCLVSARELQTLVENLLSVNKIEREQISVAVESVDLNAVFSKAIEDLQNQAKLKNITLNFMKDGALPKVLADPVRLSEVINNLVANAINYTEAGGKISVYTSSTPFEVITTVEDTGVGIPAEAIPHLFNKFFRVSNTVQKGSKGTGLGLYISKSIIQKLNGRIWVESEPGKGSKFHFSLPVARETILDRNKFVSEAIQVGALNY